MMFVFPPKENHQVPQESKEGGGVTKRRKEGKVPREGRRVGFNPKNPL